MRDSIGDNVNKLGVNGQLLNKASIVKIKLFILLFIILCYFKHEIKAQKTICYKTNEKIYGTWGIEFCFAIQVQNDTILKYIIEADSNVSRFKELVTPLFIYERNDESDLIFKYVEFNDLFKIFEIFFNNFEKNYNKEFFNPEKETITISTILEFCHFLSPDLKNSISLYFWDKYKVIDYFEINNLKNDFNPRVNKLIVRDLSNLDYYFYLINSRHNVSENDYYFIDSLLYIRFDYIEKFNKENYFKTMEDAILNNIKDSNLYLMTIDYLYDHFNKIYNSILIKKLESLTENEIIATIKLLKFMNDKDLNELIENHLLLNNSIDIISREKIINKYIKQ